MAGSGIQRLRAQGSSESSGEKRQEDIWGNRVQSENRHTMVHERTSHMEV